MSYKQTIWQKSLVINDSVPGYVRNICTRVLGYITCQRNRIIIMYKVLKVIAPTILQTKTILFDNLL